MPDMDKKGTTKINTTLKKAIKKYPQEVWIAMEVAAQEGSYVEETTQPIGCCCIKPCNVIALNVTEDRCWNLGGQYWCSGEGTHPEVQMLVSAKADEPLPDDIKEIIERCAKNPGSDGT